MLYYLHLLVENAPVEGFGWLRIFRYVTFRTLAGAGTSVIFSLVIGPWLIEKLRLLKIGQQVRTDAVLKMHGKKAGTPTMGGVLIVASVVFSTLLWSVPTNVYVILARATTCYMGLVGFLDDYLKVTKRRSKGLGGRSKLVLQTLWAVVVVGALYAWAPSRENVTKLMVPFLKTPLLVDMGLLGTLVFLWLVMVGSTNAVNLTDGLDGLAIGCSNSAALAYTILAYVAGNSILAKYLQVPFVAGAHELAVFCGCLLGAGLGFLWFNCHPARVFMGDTGSLALGGAIAMVAIAIKQEILLVIVGGVFVMEAFSVIVQVLSFKTTGRRVFKCSPLHHHYELVEKELAEKEGRDIEVVETMITTRFWILSIIFALLGVATLKIR